MHIKMFFFCFFFSNGLSCTGPSVNYTYVLVFSGNRCVWFGLNFILIVTDTIIYFSRKIQSIQDLTKSRMLVLRSFPSCVWHAVGEF